MKLYLSSVLISNGQAFRSLFTTAKPKIAVIANAWDVYPQVKAEPFLTKIHSILVDLGFEVTDIDLRKTQDKALLTQLSSLDGIWVTGGNAFYMNYLMHQSGFAGHIADLVQKGLVYGGESAGAVLTGPTLRGAQLMDNVADAPEVIWDGFKLVDFGIIPHWDNPKYSDRLNAMRDEMSKYTTVRPLNDNQAIKVADESVELV
jgi:dipeptidase E